jgi:hypothetical protein
MAEKDGSGFDDRRTMAIAKEERRLENRQVKAEAAEESLGDLIKKALKQEDQKQALAKDCLDGVKGNKQGKLEQAGFGALREGEVTGYEEYPWDNE